MRSRMLIAAAVAGLLGSEAAAQLRVPNIIQRVIPGTRQNQQPQLVGIDALRADFAARSGSSTVFFGGDSALLGVPAKTTLAAQAQWLMQHPEVVVQIEGHANSDDTRSHALAVAVRRAEEVRQYLVLLGVPAAQISAVGFGKEQAAGAANARAVTILVR